MQTKINRSHLPLEIICLAFIFLFVYAAASKLIDYAKFRIQLAQSPLLTAFAEWIAWMIPAIEVIISILIAVGTFRTVGLYAAFALMVLFTFYIISILNFSEFIPCSCGGILSKMSWRDHLIFNCFFIVLAFAGVVLQSKRDPKNSSLTGV